MRGARRADQDGLPRLGKEQAQWHDPTGWAYRLLIAIDDASCCLVLSRGVQVIPEMSWCLVGGKTWHVVDALRAMDPTGSMDAVDAMRSMHALDSRGCHGHNGRSAAAVAANDALRILGSAVMRPAWAVYARLWTPGNCGCERYGCRGRHARYGHLE